MTCLDLSRCLRPEIQISISARMSESIRSKNYAWEGLSCFVGRFRISILGWMLKGDNNISRGAVMGTSMFPHPVSLVELRGQIVMFSEMWGVLWMLWQKMCACWWETHVKIIVKGIWWSFMVGFYEQMCAGVYLYVQLYGTVDETEWHEAGFSDDVFVICGKTWVIWYHFVICVNTNKIYEYRKMRVICNHLVVHVHTNKYTENAQSFKIWLIRVFVVFLRA